MTPEEKAEQIYSMMDKYTDGYVGSSMLSNFEFEDVKVSRTVEASIKIVDEIVANNPRKTYGHTSTSGYWEEVKQHLLQKNNFKQSE